MKITIHKMVVVGYERGIGLDQHRITNHLCNKRKTSFQCSLRWEFVTCKNCLRADRRKKKGE